VVKDEAGEIVALHCTYDPDTRGGKAPDGRKVKGTLHWVSAAHSLKAEARLYDRLFATERPGAGDADWLDELNPNSLQRITDARVEPSVAGAEPGARFQFERQGYFCVDPVDGGLHFNRIVTLKDSWAKAGASEPRRKPRSKAPSKPVERTFSDTPLQLVQANPELRGLFEEAVDAHNNPEAIANWLANDVARELKDQSADSLRFTGAAIGQLVALIDDKTISTKIAKDVFEELLATGDAPAEIVDRKGLRQVSDSAALEAVIDEIIAANPDETARYRDGNKNLIGFFVGQVMKATRGKANPKRANELLRARL